MRNLLWLGLACLANSCCLFAADGVSDAKEQVDRLIAAARIYDPEEMEAAIEEIVKIGSPAIPELLPALRDFDDNVRWQAVLALGKMGKSARGEVPRIVLMLGDDDSDVRAAAAEALGMLGVGKPEVAIPLEKCLEDPHGIVRASANWALWKFREDGKYIAGLVMELASADWIVTGRVVRHLASIGKPAAPHLAAYIARPGLPGRYLAAQAFARMDGFPDAVIPILVRCLDEGNPQLAMASAEALGRAGRAAVPALLVAMESGSPGNRRFASEALGLVGKPASLAVPKLIRQLGEPDHYLRLATLCALGRIGANPPGTEAMLGQLLGDPDPDIRGAACDALGRLGMEDNGTFLKLRELSTGDRKDFVRQAAKSALKAQGTGNESRASSYSRTPVTGNSAP